MTRNYYFLAASLVDLSWGHGTPSGDMEALVDYLEPALDPEDAVALRQLFLFSDMRNAISLHENRDAFVTPSCYDRKTLIETSEGGGHVLPFLNEFFDMLEQNARRFPEIPLIDELTIMFYDGLHDIQSDFVRDYFLRELDVRNLTIALSLEGQGFPYRERLVPRGEVYEAIMKGSPPDFGLATDFPFVQDLVRVFKTTDLTAHEETMERIRWQWLDDRVGPEFFSTEFILAYAVKYQAVARWQALSEEKGDELLGELLNTVRRSVRFSLEFSEIGEKKDDSGQSNSDQQ